MFMWVGGVGSFWWGMIFVFMDDFFVCKLCQLVWFLLILYIFDLRLVWGLFLCSGSDVGEVRFFMLVSFCVCVYSYEEVSCFVVIFIWFFIDLLVLLGLLVEELEFVFLLVFEF